MPPVSNTPFSKTVNNTVTKRVLKAPITLDAEAQEHLEVHGSTWLGISRWAEYLLAEAQDELAIPGLPEGPTEAARARIALLKRLLALPQVQTGEKKFPPALNY